MSQQQFMQLVMEARIRHDSTRRMVNAYRQLWRMQQIIPISPPKKEDGDNASSAIRPGFDPTSGTGSDD